MTMKEPTKSFGENRRLARVLIYIRNWFCAAVASVVLLAAGTTAGGADSNFTFIDYPGAEGTSVSGVSWENIAGNYQSNSTSDGFPTARGPSQPPVVVVPGAPGSLSSCLFVDPDSGQPCPASQDFHYGAKWLLSYDITLTPDWVLDPIQQTKTYDTLVNSLRAAGAQVFPVPYDWRNKSQDTAGTILANTITNARQQSGHNKVDIVAHSMGGLVARLYIENLKKSDVRKLIMLGTPNRGSADAYFMWEGGETSSLGFFIGNLFMDPLLESMKVGYGCTSESDSQFIQDKIPSIRQLLPIDNYIYKLSGVTLQKVNVHTMNWQNDLIPTLNYNKLINKLGWDNIRICAGTNVAKTTKTINVIETDPSILPQWEDGTPVTKGYPFSTSGSGDGTVLLNNAKLGNITVIEKPGVLHFHLPDTCKRDAVTFLAGQQTLSQEPWDIIEKPSAVERPSVQGLLFIGTRDRIHMGITTAEGLRVGNFLDREGKISELENYYYLGNRDHTDGLGIYNPLQGEYILSVTTKEPELDYEVYVSYSDKTGKKKQWIKGTITNGSIQNYTIVINDKLEVL
ncbi:MAG: alpha/beta fold hydrolase [Syntrophobacteraceae bacterium]|jgi:pimeloyl-ACP methyl ester carboxylesterase